MDATRSATLKKHLRPAELRPVLTSLNGDNSWLMSFPRPEDERAATGKAFYHIVFEPWLAGPTSFLSSWFIHVSLTKAPAVCDPAAIEGVIGQIEDAARNGRPRSESAAGSDSEDEARDAYRGGIDAILLGFHYLDHTHEATLRLFDARIPVVATLEAARLVQGYNHFHEINLIHNLPASAETWRSPELHPGGSLPAWLWPLRMPGHHELNFCLAIIWSHADAAGIETQEAILSSPHGIRLDSGPLQAFLRSKPATKKLAMLHGFKESHTMGWQTTLGARGGLALFRSMGDARYWIATHHSELAYEGAMMRLLRVVDTPRTLQWALEEEKMRVDDAFTGTYQQPRAVQVDNGQCFVLE
ncbi:hypothetical protein HIM_07646 [Hirsutella minnesotensis 3608]|uniref:Uncharacterized protein n=1 Tax=Hirsutella minnesotensis 3608 TaxID=1043627 RepID=A0A0F7ZTC7_9HYPO|nr:hypothetical protein HIM_07646 [Hirsutella minnesotensis 3608]